MAYVLPQVQVFEAAATNPASIVDPLRAAIIGPHYHLQRYTDADEKSTGQLGAYNPDAASTDYDWPGRPTGAVVDQGYTRLFVDDAYLRYATDPLAEVLTRNYVKSSMNLVEYVNPVNGTTYARDASLLRDVQIGDVAIITGPFPGETLTATVIGFVHEQEASEVGAATVDEANDVAAGAAPADTKTVDLGSNLDITAADASAYDGRADGDVSETYTIEVTTGGASGVAKLSVLSASGRDDVSSVTAIKGSPMAIGTRGLTVTFTGAGTLFVQGEKWEVTCEQTYAAVTAVSDTVDAGNPYAGPTDTTYIVEVTTGGASGAAKVTVTTTNGVDASGPHTVTSGSPITIGTHGVRITLTGANGFSKGDKFYVPVVAVADGAIQTIITSKNLPNSMVPGQPGGYYFEPVTLELFIKDNIELPACNPSTGEDNFTQAATEIVVNGSITVLHDEWVDDAGEMQPISLRAGTLYVHYRALLTTYSSGVNTLEDVTDVESLLGPAVPDNPLSLGVFKAASNSNNTSVKFVAVPTDNYAGYNAAISMLVGRQDTWGIVPLTYDRQVQDLVVAHVKEMSAPESGRWRTAWLGCQTLTQKQIGDEQLCTIEDDPDNTGTQYTLLFADGATFIADGVVAGDIVRTLFSTDLCGNETYQSFVVDAVINEETLRLASGPESPVSVARKMEIWRALTKDQQADLIGDFAASFRHKLVRCVWPDNAASGDLVMPSYFMAAALAGERSGVVPQQGLTNVSVTGFDDVRDEYFNKTQLDRMAGKGVWIVTKDPVSGAIFTRHQVTTADTSLVDEREDSVVAIIHAISYYYLTSLSRIIGRANVIPATLNLIETQIMAGTSYLKTYGFNELAGGLIVDAEIQRLEAHPVLKDRVIVDLLIIPPRPLNNIDLTLVI